MVNVLFSNSADGKIICQANFFLLFSLYSELKWDLKKSFVSVFNASSLIKIVFLCACVYCAASTLTRAALYSTLVDKFE